MKGKLTPIQVFCFHQILRPHYQETALHIANTVQLQLSVCNVCTGIIFERLSKKTIIKISFSLFLRRVAVQSLKSYQLVGGRCLLTPMKYG